LSKRKIDRLKEEKKPKSKIMKQANELKRTST